MLQWTVMHCVNLHFVVLDWGTLHSIVMQRCIVQLRLCHVHCVVCCIWPCGCTVHMLRYTNCWNWLYDSNTQQLNILLCALWWTLCSAQGQTQKSYRIFLMHLLLPGNSCPGLEVNGCPWPLFLFISVFAFIFFPLKIFFFMFLAGCENGSITFKQPLSLSREKWVIKEVLWVFGQGTSSDFLNEYYRLKPGRVDLLFL